MGAPRLATCVPNVWRRSWKRTGRTPAAQPLPRSLIDVRLLRVVLLAGVKTILIDSLRERARRLSARPALFGLILSVTAVAVRAVALPLPYVTRLRPRLPVAVAANLPWTVGRRTNRITPRLFALRETTVNAGDGGEAEAAGIVTARVRVAGAPLHRVAIQLNTVPLHGPVPVTWRVTL